MIALVGDVIVAVTEHYRSNRCHNHFGGALGHFPLAFAGSHAVWMYMLLPFAPTLVRCKDEGNPDRLLSGVGVKARTLCVGASITTKMRVFAPNVEINRLDSRYPPLRTVEHFNVHQYASPVFF